VQKIGVKVGVGLGVRAVRVGVRVGIRVVRVGVGVGVRVGVVAGVGIKREVRVEGVKV
jgi:hypothetical protein